MTDVISAVETADNNWIEVTKPKSSKNKESPPTKTVKRKSNPNTPRKPEIKTASKVDIVEHAITNEECNQNGPNNKNDATKDVNPWVNNSNSTIDSLGLSLNQMTITEQRSEVVITPDEFCSICRDFKVSSEERMKFYVRGLVNTGCACFRNCIFQALLTLKPFVSLISHLLRTLSDPSRLPVPSFSVWRELLSLMQEFASVSSVNNSNSSGIPVRPASAATKKGVFSGMGGKHGSKSIIAAGCISANHHMSGLFQAFQKNIDAIRPPPSNRISNRLSNKQLQQGANRTTQEDAMEFLTFLLDALHEELAGQEKRSLAEKTMSINAVATVGNSETTNAVVEDSSVTSTSESVSGDTVDLEVVRAPEEECDGWSTVNKSKFKYVIDAPSREAVRVSSEASVIYKIFHGTLRSEVTYQKKKICSATFQRFFTITLDMGSTAAANALLRKNRFGLGGSGYKESKAEPLSLEQCLDTYFAEESLSDGGEIKKQLKLETLPEVLILQLSRFSYDYHKMLPVKILQEVTYPLELVLPERYMSVDLADRIHSQNSDSGGSGKDKTICAQYVLSAVVLHHGEKTQNGHYSTYARELLPSVTTVDGTENISESGPTGTNATTEGEKTSVWHSLNDTKKNVLTEQMVLGATSMAYILFYTKK